VGRYLFYRQNNLGGHIDVGSGDGALLGEGWGDRREVDGRACRRPQGAARALAPLDVPEDLDLTLAARIETPGEMGIRHEDCIFITETGAELLTPQSPSIENPFG